MLFFINREISFLFVFQTHIERILNSESVRDRWRLKHGGQEPRTEDVDRMYQNFLSSTLEVLSTHSHVIKGTSIFYFSESIVANVCATQRFCFIGASDTIQRLRSTHGLKIGSSTGYSKEIMAELAVGNLQKKSL